MRQEAGSEAFARNDENTVMAGLDLAISGQRQMRGSSPRMTKRMGERENFPLDNIPNIE
jgi:hypothetical protein